MIDESRFGAKEIPDSVIEQVISDPGLVRDLLASVGNVSLALCFTQVRLAGVERAKLTKHLADAREEAMKLRHRMDALERRNTKNEAALKDRFSQHHNRMDELSKTIETKADKS